MKLTILGCGTSAGVPMPGCECEVCTSKNPKNSRMKTSALISSDNEAHPVILIDAGTDFRHQALRVPIKKIDAVLFTHSHADHILGVEDLRPYNHIQKGHIPCFGSEETLKEIRRVFAYVFSEDREYEGGPKPELELKQIDYLTPFKTHDIEIMPFHLHHGKTNVTGFRIGDLAYATDCKKIPEKSYECLKGLNTLIIDGLRYEPHGTHMTIDEAIFEAKKIGAKTTYLTHMTHTIEYEKVSKSLPENIKLAYDGLEIKITL